MALLSVLVLSLLLVSLSSASLAAQSDSQSFGVQYIERYGALGQLALDSGGFIYAAQQPGYSFSAGVVKLAPDGSLVHFFNLSSIATSPTAVALSRTGELYVSSSTSPPAVLKLSAAGDVLATYRFSGYPTYPSGIAVDSADNLYVCFVDVVVKYNPSGGAVLNFTTSSPSLRYPYGVVVESGTNHLYVMDTDNRRLVKFDSDGTVLATAPYSGGGPAWSCVGITIDERDGSVVLGCQPTVQRFSTDLTLIASYWQYDNRVYQTRGIAVSRAGVIYLGTFPPSNYIGFPSILALHFELCPAGNFCSAGVDSAISCPVGYYCPANQTVYAAQMLQCPAYQCCPTRGMVLPVACSSASPSYSSASFAVLTLVVALLVQLWV